MARGKALARTTPPITPHSLHKLLQGQIWPFLALGTTTVAGVGAMSPHAQLQEPPRRPKPMGDLLPRGTLFINVTS